MPVFLPMLPLIFTSGSAGTLLPSLQEQDDPPRCLSTPAGLEGRKSILRYTAWHFPKAASSLVDVFMTNVRSRKGEKAVGETEAMSGQFFELDFFFFLVSYG